MPAVRLSHQFQLVYSLSQRSTAGITSPEPLAIEVIIIEQAIKLHDETANRYSEANSIQVSGEKQLLFWPRNGRS